MKFTVDKEHRDFFQKNGFIEFENFFSIDQTEQLNRVIDRVIDGRITGEQIGKPAADRVFAQSRDLWRSDTELRNFVCRPGLGQQVSELLETKPIRLGYDQFFPSYPVKSTYGIQSPYAQFLSQNTTLENIGSITGILCGLMISLSPSEEHETPAYDGVDIFPCKQGNAIFFRPDVGVDLERLSRHPGRRYYLIVFTRPISAYTPRSTDPFSSALKHLGYIQHARLSDKLHPVIYR